MMNVRVIYKPIDLKLLDQMEEFGLDYINFLKLLVMSCNSKMYSINLVESWLNEHDSFYNHPDMVSVLRQIAQYCSFTVRPYNFTQPPIRCQIEALSENQMVVVYEFK